MPFDLSFPTIDASDKKLQIEPGETLYILGANGTGKSSLLQHFTLQNYSFSKWITAHRQTWLDSDTSDMTLANKRHAEPTIHGLDIEQQARYRDDRAHEKISIALYNLIISGNSKARAIKEQMDQDDCEKAKKLLKEATPIDVINGLFQQSNIPIHLRISDDERLMAHNENGAQYGASEMSDGERNALLIAANISTAYDGTLFLIDEPERHLHRSIIAPLLNYLFKYRKDCGFVISTHDIDLPLATPEARILLLRACSPYRNNSRRWTADELASGEEIDERLKRDLLGARRKILFVEGSENSLDKRLYSCIFPSVSVISKGGCAEVKRAVAGLRSGEKMHRLQVSGIIDGDGLDDDEIEAVRKQEGVYTLPYYSVEAIYFHPDMIERIAKMKADEFGSDESKLYKDAIDAGIAAVDKNKDHLSQHRAKQLAKRKLMSQLPNDNALLAGFSETICVGGVEIYQEAKDSLSNTVEEGNWEEILRMCPIRESEARDKIAKTLHYRDAADYEKAVIGMLQRDKEAANFVKGLLGDLVDSLSDMHAQQGNAE